MSTSFKSTVFFPAAVLAALSAAASAFADQTSVVRFSKPSEPGRIIIQIGFGDVTVTGADVKEVTIGSETSNKSNPEPRKDGLRRLDSDDGYTATEANNVITITHDSMFKGGRRGGSADMNVTVPRATSVSIERAAPGDTELQNIAGDVEVRGAAGDVKLTDVSGGVVVENANGDVEATFAALTEGKPIAITVPNGDVRLRVPARAKANVRFHTLRGEILTDFSDKELESRMENAGDMALSVNTNVDAARVKLETDKARIELARAASEQERAAREQARADAEQAREQARVEAERARAARADSASDAPAAPAAPPAPPIPPSAWALKASKMRPPMTGGHLVVGKLNGGGPEIIITAVNGSIKFQKIE